MDGRGAGTDGLRELDRRRFLNSMGVMAVGGMRAEQGSRIRVALRYARVAALVLLAAFVALVAVRVVRRLSVPAASALPGGPGHLVVHQIPPGAVDPALSGPDDPNIAMVQRGAHWNGLLLVFLPGTGGRPGCCELFLRTGASIGYHAIGLTYDNQKAVGARCLNDLSCFATVRHEVFDGATPSAYLDLPPGDGVEHRLTALLDYLAARYPREGWNRFIADGVPRWGRIVISGHSQGGGEAAFIGTLEPLRGVVTLSSPPDTNLSHQAAPWLGRVPDGPTPLGRIVAFVHSGDPFYDRIVADWAAMGLGGFGPLRDVDSSSPPYGHSHQLISFAPLPLVILATHDSTAVDSATPGCSNGSPEYAPVWRYMLEVAGGLRVTSGKPPC